MKRQGRWRSEYQFLQPQLLLHLLSLNFIVDIIFYVLH